MVQKLLNRLLKKAGLQIDRPPADLAQWHAFQELTRQAMAELKDRQEIAENSLAVNSTEMDQLYAALSSRAESQLEDHRIFLTTVVDSLPVAVYCKKIDDDFRYVLWNRAAAMIFGLDSAEVIGKTDHQLYAAQAAEIRRLDKETCVATDVIAMPEEVIERGEQRLMIRTRRAIVRSHDGTPRLLLGVAEDITAERQARESLIHSAKLASLGEMAGGIAHEINNPLGIIHGYATMLQRILQREATPQAKVIDLAQSIIETAERIETIVKGLRSFSRRGDNDPTRPENLHDVVAAAVSLCSERFKNHSVELRLELPTEPLLVPCRQVQIGQVLLNLLGNAFDAVKDLSERWVVVKAVAIGDTLRLSITDSGNGIPEATRSRIMQPFFTTKEVGKGTGLGLSISSTIISGHGGTLSYDDHNPHTSFVIKLPLRAVAGGDVQVLNAA